jgi:predicted aldo/keto reductase-like oxidoreductase
MAPCPSCQGARTRATARVRWPIRIALIALTFAIALLGVAPRMIGMLEGVRAGFAPAIPFAIVAGVVGLLAFVAGFVRVQRPVCLRCDAAEPAWLFVPIVKHGPIAGSSDAAENTRPSLADTGRRSFLTTAGAVGASGVATAAAGAAGVLLPNARWRDVGQNIFFADVEKNAPVQRSEWAGSRVKSYRRLGRTDAMVSDISLGSGGIDDIQVAIRAIDRGVNYFDTAPDYSHHGSELLLGKAIRETGGRDKMFLATKFCTADGHLPKDTPVPDIIKAVEGSLERLQTDHVDLIHVHSCDDVDRLMAPSFHEAFDRMKEQGKVRFLGFSSHTPRLEQVARTAIASNRFDVMMLAYHHGLWPQLGEVIDEAHAKDLGVVAMKTLKGAKAENFGMRDESVAYSQAAFRWVLQNPSVSCLVVSFTKVEQCDEYLFASGTPVKQMDLALLHRYDNLASADYCRPHCGACLDACPVGLPIDTVLRYDMYFADYRREAIAREKYARLTATGLDASACAACPAPCAGTCPYELPVRAKMVRAHERLTAI